MLFLCKFCGLFIALCLPVCIRNDQYCRSHTVPLLISKRVFMRKAWCFTSAEGSVRDLLPNCDQKSSIKCRFCKVEGSSSLSAREAAATCYNENRHASFFLFFFCIPRCTAQHCKPSRKISTQEKVHFPPRTVRVQHLHRGGSVTPPTGPHLRNLSQHLCNNLDRNKDLLFI